MSEETTQPQNSTNINPLTGLPTGKTVNPLTGKVMTSPTKSARTSVTGSYSMPGDQKEFTSYGVQISPYSDMNEQRAINQSWYGQAFNGIAKGFSTLGTSVISNFAALPGGAIDWIGETIGSSKTSDLGVSLADNFVTRGMYNLNEYVRESLPNYLTKEEQYDYSLADIRAAALGIGESGSGVEKSIKYLPEEEKAARIEAMKLAENYEGEGMNNPFTANFIFDKMLGGAAYSAASYVTMLASRGRGPVGTIGKATGASGNISRSLASWRASKHIAAGKTQRQAVRKGLSSTNSLMSALGTLEASATMSAAEASIEALEVGDNVTKEALQNFKEAKAAQINAANVTNPVHIKVTADDVELTAQEIQAATMAGENAKGALFWANMAVLMPTNLILFGRQVAPFKMPRSISNATSKLTNRNRYNPKTKQYEDVLDRLPKGIGKVAKAGRFALPYIGGAITEGFQEGMQSALSDGITEYELRALHDSGASEYAKKYLNNHFFRTAGEAAGAAGTIAEYAKTKLALKEGQTNEEILIGAVIGVLSKGKAGYRAVQEKNKRNEEILGLLNSPEFYNLAQKAEDLNAGSALVVEMLQAQEQGNEAKYRRLQSELVTDSILNHIRLGSIDQYLERWEDAKNLPEEEFKKALGIDPDFKFTDKFTKEDMVNKIINQVDKVQEGIDLIEKLFPTSQPYAANFIMGKKLSEREKKRMEDEQVYKEALIRNYANMEFMDSDIDTVLNEIQSTFEEGVFSNIFKKRFQRSKRKRFGEVESVELPTVEEDTADEKNSRKKSKKKKGETTELEFILPSESKELDELLKELEVLSKEHLSAPEQALVAERAKVLRELIESRNKSALALDNLYKNPKERDLYLSRLESAKRAAERKQRDAEFEAMMDDIVDPDEMRKAVKNHPEKDNISQGVRDKINKRYAADKQKIAQYRKEFDRMKKSEVEGLDIEDPLKELARKKHLENRTQEDPIETEQEKAERLKKEAEARQEAERRRRADEAERARQEEEERRRANNEDDINVPENPVITPPVDTSDDEAYQQNGDMLTISNNVGEFVLTDDGKVEVVDGVPITGNIHAQRTVNGEPIISKDARKILTSPEALLEGDEVELIAMEDDWWALNKNRPENQDAFASMPVYISYKGEIVGVLRGGKTKLRSAAIAEYLNAKQEGREAKKITTTVATKFGTNQISASQDDVPYFNNVVDIFGEDVPVGVVTYSPTSPSGKKLQLGNTFTLSDAELDALENSILIDDEKLANLAFGQVVALVKAPTGNWTFNVLHTAKLSEAEQVKALELLVNSNNEEVYNELLELVGLNKEPNEVVQTSTDGAFLTVSESLTGKDERIVQFKAPVTIDHKGRKYVISITTSRLKRLLEAFENPGTDIKELAKEIFEDENALALLIKRPITEAEAEQYRQKEKDKENAPNIGMDEAAKALVLSGAKSLDIRDYDLKSGVYKVNGKLYKFTNRGKLFVDEAGGASFALEKGQFQNSPQAVPFLQGRKSMYVIDIVPVSDVKTTQNLEEGKLRGIGKEIITTQEQVEKILAEVIPAIKDELSKKRRQVSILELQTDKKYLSKIANEQSEAAFDAKGVNNVLSTSTAVVEGSTFRDVGLSFNREVKVDGKSYEHPVTPIQPSSNDRSLRDEVNARVENRQSEEERFNRNEENERERQEHEEYEAYLREKEAQEGKVEAQIELNDPSILDAIFGNKGGQSETQEVEQPETPQVEEPAGPVEVERTEGEVELDDPFGFDEKAERRAEGVADEYVEDSSEFQSSQGDESMLDLDYAKNPFNYPTMGNYIRWAATQFKQGVSFRFASPAELKKIFPKESFEELIRITAASINIDESAFNRNFENYDVPFRLKTSKPKTTLNQAEAEAWLKERGIPVEFYELAKQVGSATAHGFMKNATVYLWRNAEVGTEYHEAFHFVFRMLLNDKQRAALYKEAEKRYGKPSAEDIASAKRGQSKLSEQEAYELALEEKLAEEFRDYVMTDRATETTLSGKIKNFFKDIWNYIMSVFKGGVGIDQLFDMIESNKMPASFSRNTERFAPDTSYRLVDTVLTKDYLHYRQIIDTLSHHFQHMVKENFDDMSTGEQLMSVEKMLGSGDGKGLIAEHFLRNAFSNEDGTAISDNVFEAIKNILNNTEITEQQRMQLTGKLIKQAGVKLQVGSKNNNVPRAARRLDDKARTQNARIFFEIYNNWYDKVDDRLGNIEKAGWRNAVIEDLEKYGYRFNTDIDIFEADLDNDVEDGNYNEDEEVNADKIYNITHFENNPKERVSAEVRKLFGRMIKSLPNKLGYHTYADIDASYKAAVHATVGLESFEEMAAAIKKQSEYFDELVPIANYLNPTAEDRANDNVPTVTAEDAAMIRSLLSLDLADHRFLLTEYNDDGASVKIINSDRRSRHIAYKSLWELESLSGVVERPNAIYVKTEDGYLKVNNNEINGKKRFDHIQEALRNFYAADELDTVEAQVVAKGEAMSDILWYMSMGFGPTIDISRQRVVKHLSTASPAEAKAMEGYMRTLLAKVGDVIVSRSKVEVTPKTNVNGTFFDSEGTSVKKLAEAASSFALPTALAFVSGRGKTIYPYNTGSHYTHLMKEIVAGKDSELYKKLKEDPAFTGFGEAEFESFIFTLMSSRNFEIESFSLDTIKDEDNENNEDYSELSERSSLIVRLNTYLNSGTDFAYYPISIQEDRGRMDFIKLPKFTSKKSMQKAGLKYKSPIELFESIIVRDLIRIATDPSIAKKMNYGMHLNIVNSGLTTQEELLELVALVEGAIEHRGSEEYKEFWERIAVIASDYSEDVFEEHVKDFMDKLEEFKIVQFDEEGAMNVSNTRLDVEGMKKIASLDRAGFEKIMKSYVLGDLVARVEFANVFRGGATQAKSVEDFYKRMGLINTPGTRLMIAGEFAGDPNYGFLKDVIQGVIDPVDITDKEHNDIADRLQKFALAAGATKAEAQEIRDQYRIGNLSADRTDGQAFISPKMHRAIEMGLGTWTKANERAYQKYLKGATWEMPYTANRKFYYENVRLVDGQLKPEMVKNSYVVVTRDFANGNEFLLDMHDRMMGEGKYKGQGEVHLINTTSAIKGWGSAPKDVNKAVQTKLEINDAGELQETEPGRFSGMELINQDGTKFLMPQIINPSNKTTTRMNRQIRKNMISNIDPAAIYNHKGKNITGQELLDIYNNAMEEILVDENKKLLNRMGYFDMKSNPDSVEKRITFLKNIRALILSNANKNSALDSNMYDQLQLVEYAEQAMVDFAMPLAFPAYQRKYQNLIFSLFKNNVHRIDVAGKELVQVASTGKYRIPKTASTKALTKIAKGVKELFESNPELAAIGTPEQYSAYLDSLFPDSKVKDIVYHAGWKRADEKFDVSKSNDGEFGKGIYFTPSYQSAVEYAAIMGDAPHIVRAVVNLKNPVEFGLEKPKKGESKEYTRSKLAENPNNDGIIYNGKQFTKEEQLTYGVDENQNDELKVNSAEQVIVLGSKEDIEGFKKFAANESDVEVRELRYIDVEKDGSKLKHAEVIVSEDLLEKLGLELGETGIAYRIPHQGYSSTIPIRVVSVLPKSYSKTIIVPGNITIQTGSDFDIDKLFVMLRDKKTTGKGVENRNTLLDVLETITLSKNNFLDTIKPLDQVELNELAGRDYIKREAVFTFDHPLTESRIESNYKSAGVLVGAYANGLSGFSVAVHATSMASNARGLSIHESKVFRVEKGEKTYVLNRIQRISKMTGRIASAGMTERLSAALDAGKKLIHLSINDNKHTVNAAIFLSSIGMDQETIVHLMAQPLVREFVQQLNNTGQKDYQILEKMGVIIKSEVKEFRENINDAPVVLKLDEMIKVIKEDDVTSENATNLFRAFVAAHFAGKELANIYRSITPDTADGMGDTAQVAAYLDSLDDVRRRGEFSLVPEDQIEELLEGDDYRLSKGFLQNIISSEKVTGELFLGPSEAVKSFKAKLKDFTGKTRISEKEHRYIDRMLFYYMATKENSPLASLLNKKEISKLFTSPSANIYAVIQDLKEKNPKLESNFFLSKMKQSNSINKDTNRVYDIEMDNTEKLTSDERQKLLTSLHNLMYNADMYAADEAQQKRIEILGKAIVQNALVTTGLAPTYGAYYDAIPIQFFTNLTNSEGVNTAEFFTKEFKKAQADSTYFDEFMFEFMRNFGTTAVSGIPLVPRLNTDLFSLDDAKNPTTFTPTSESMTDFPLFATARFKKQRIDRIKLFMWDGNAYRLVESKGVGGRFIEVNLREDNGDVSTHSIWSKESGVSRRVNAEIGKNKYEVVELYNRGGAATPVVPVYKSSNSLDSTSNESLNNNC